MAHFPSSGYRWMSFAITAGRFATSGEKSATPSVPAAVSVGIGTGSSARRISSGSTLEPAVAPVLKALEGGFSRIGPIKREIGLSSRHLSSIDGAQGVDWAALALRYRFPDQAYLVHDFREFAGVTPSAYMSKQTDHRNHMPCDWKRRRVEWNVAG